MPSPALRPGHALLLAFPSAGRLPSTISATDVEVGFVRGFTGTMQPSDSSSLPRRLRLLDFPPWPLTAWAARGNMRSPRFRRSVLILPSTDTNASAPATLILSWLNPTPRKIAMYASSSSSPSTTQHSLPGGRYPLPGPDFHRLDRASLLAHHSRTLTVRCQLAA